MAKRIKAAALPVPESMEGADRLLGEIGELQRRLDLIDTALSEEIAHAKARAAEEATPLAAELKMKFEALLVWATSTKDEWLEDGRKSRAFGQGVLGWRWGMPTVKVARGQEDAVVETLGRLGMGDLIRTRQEVDKDAVLKDPARVAGVAGITVEQVETFFAKPLAVQAEQTKTTRRLKDHNIAQERADG